MYVVIAGCGRVGSRLATTLAEDGHDVVVVDADATNFKNLGAAFNGTTIHGTPIDSDILRDAGIEQADAFASVTRNDNVNIMAAQIATELFSVPRVAARVGDPQRIPVFHELGLRTVCATDLAADQLRILLLKEGVHHRGYLGSPQVAEVEIPVDDRHADMAITGLEKPERCRLVAVMREGRAFIPTDAYRTRAGDTMLAAVHVDALDAIMKTFQKAGR